MTTTATKTFEIVANGTVFGVYEGANERDAVEAYVRDAGYQSIEEAVEVLEYKDDADFVDDLKITEIAA